MTKDLQNGVGYVACRPRSQSLGRKEPRAARERLPTPEPRRYTQQEPLSILHHGRELLAKNLYTQLIDSQDECRVTVLDENGEKLRQAAYGDDRSSDPPCQGSRGWQIALSHQQGCKSNWEPRKSNTE
jgi:hypothetical protein